MAYTLEVPKDAKLEKVASRDQSRPVLSCIHVQTDPDGKTYLEATDSYCLVRVPVKADGKLEAGYVPLDALKASRKNGGHIMIAEGTARVGNGVQWPVTNPGQFPDCAKFIPDEDAIVFEVTFNAGLLANMAAAFGGTGTMSGVVTLGFQAARAPTIDFKDDSSEGEPSKLQTIRVTGNNGGIGVLMPVRKEHLR